MDGPPVDPAREQWVASQHKWTHGWRRPMLAALVLLYLLYVVQGVTRYSHGADAVIGYVILGAFSVCYVVTVVQTQQASAWRLWTLEGVLLALFVSELPFAHAAAFVMCVYITVVAAGRLSARAWPIVLALTLAALIVPPLIPAWHDGLATAVDNATVIAIPVVGIVTIAILQVLDSNRALAQARDELTRLAAENERFRIARDLHDLLGHSLTTITVKAGLASRLGETDPAAALREIAEVEVLTRQSLADVRAAVSNYRDVTLTRELATGRELLRAAGIAAELPGAVDVVEPGNQELFGWVVREGVTNVVRHAHASTCAVRLSASSVEILDDGVGAGRDEARCAGNGLSGLRERVAALGAVIDAGPRQPRGWRLRVSLAPERGAA
jgi:two-component system sensor histidine kinase DesK